MRDYKQFLLRQFNLENTSSATALFGVQVLHGDLLVDKLADLLMSEKKLWNEFKFNAEIFQATHFVTF